MIEDQLLEILNKYAGGSGDLIRQMQTAMKSPEILVPVLGLQGVGKSTLLNSVLGVNIMPNEADETTCIPVEVRYGEKESVTVYKLNGEFTEIDKNQIKEYVDNNYNIGNEKSISHIVIAQNSELLKKGLVLVDLPGVGSLTQSNQKVTQDYLKKLYTAIFVIRVNPPITRTEAMFIKYAWKMLNNAWFVMNRWNNETDREVIEGLETNNLTLKDIANQINIDYVENIQTVNAYSALRGIIQNKTDDVASSGIQDFIEKLHGIDEHWRIEADELFSKRVQNYINLAIKSIEDKLENINLSHIELEEKFIKHELDFEENTEKIRRTIYKVKSTSEIHKSDFKLKLRKWVQEAEENIRGNVFTVIDGGIVDGASLTEIFKNYQVQEFEMVNDNFLNYLNEKIDEILSVVEELSEVVASENNCSFDAYEFNKKQSFKWEKGMEAGIKIGGNLGGVFASIAVGGKVGAIAGTAIGGPAGTVIGAVAGIGTGLIISVLSSLIGSKSKQLVTADRASKTKRELRPVIEEVCQTFKKQITKGFEEVYANIENGLNEYYTDRIKALAILKEKNLRELENEKINLESKDNYENELTFLKNKVVNIHE
ncbi:conserved protein of unknown function [Petrocella atlantisensis]|uniref:Dynamin N-terminal domain-containing protein n=1 Tax=Petrocella atlantisensis TaxID=2173034 RepID=A0A3P7PAN9_9FIRM|nr:dynamin family protein [Petrocella atlantisensis]VDN47243.1 conserved protein of unknown function [Petrocella atlantisensis]